MGHAGRKFSGSSESNSIKGIVVATVDAWVKQEPVPHSYHNDQNSSSAIAMAC